MSGLPIVVPRATRRGRSPLCLGKHQEVSQMSPANTRKGCHGKVVIVTTLCGGNHGDMCPPWEWGDRFPVLARPHWASLLSRPDYKALCGTSRRVYNVMLPYLNTPS